MQIHITKKGRAQRIQVSISAPATQTSRLGKVGRNVRSRIENLCSVPFHVVRRYLDGHKRLLFKTGLVVGFVAGYMCASQAFAYAHQVVYAEHIVNHAVHEPIRVAFTRPVRRGLHYAWQEKIDGSWQLEKQLGSVKALVFTPKKPFVPNSILHLKLTGVQPAADILSRTPSEQIVQVVVERASRVAAYTPASKSENISVNTELLVRLSSPNRGLRTLVISGDIPVVSPHPRSGDDTTFRWKLKTALEQGKTYHAEVRDMQQTAEKQVVATFDFTTVAEPHVATNVSGYIRQNQTIQLSFDQDMKQDEKMVQFAMPGKGSWQGPRSYMFTTSLVVPGSNYSYKVLKGATSVYGGVVNEDRIFYAQTPGNVKVVAAQPSGSRVPLTAAISLTFDQSVDRASAENAFYLQPKVAGSFSWSGNTMTYHVSGLAEQTMYSYGVAPGIKPVFGLTGVAYDRQFTTVPPVRKLAVPFYRQAYALSCEAASLRMALAYYGVGASDMDILTRIGYNPQPRDTATNTWQDPNVEFVGDVNGKLNVTGWGVYAGPVAKAARSFGRNADIVYSPSASSVASAIYAGRPVVMWGVMGWSAVDDSWNTATSGVVHAAKNQHVRLVYGVEGTAANPVGFFVNDPIRGSVYLSADALQASMNGGGRQILVVY